MSAGSFPERHDLISPGRCPASENNDGDHFFCEPARGDLAPVFRKIAEATIQHSHLFDI